MRTLALRRGARVAVVAAEWCDAFDVVTRGRVQLALRDGEPGPVLAKHLPRAFRPERGARAVTAEELTGEADLRLWVLRADRWQVHISSAHPTLGSGTDRRTPVDPTE